MNATKSDVAQLLREIQRSWPKRMPAEVFAPRFQQARALSQDLETKQASRVNLFSLFGLERREAVHSTLIANFLDPLAAHGQGILFFQKFLEVAKLSSVPSDLIHRKPTDFWVDKEFSIPAGRFDIIVTCMASRFLLVIENKIDHKEGELQLNKYRDWMDSQRHLYHNVNLIFLTPKGDKTQTLDESKYLPLSYENHIVPWLESCRHWVPSRLSATIDQYLSIIKTVSEGGVMSEYDESLLGFLREPGNFMFFAELEKVSGRIEAELKRRFWSSIASRAREALTNADNVNIRFLPSDDAPTGLRLSYSSDSESDNDCFVALEQDGNTGLLFDVRFVKEVDQTSAALSEILERIRNVLKERGFKAQPIDKQSPKSLWIGWLYVSGYSVNDPATLSRLVDNDGFINAVASGLVELFESIGGEISRLHHQRISRSTSE